MIKDFLISFTDNLKEKTRNPFLGTYLLVWLIRNWELIYTLFNFDNDCNLNEKKEFIFSYYKKNDFITNLFTNILWSFGLLILTYALLNLSRFIVNLFEKKLTPWIYKVTDSNSIVLKETYDKLKSENNILELNLEKERESKGRLQIEISKLEKKIEDSNSFTNSISVENNEQNKIGDETELMFKKIKEKDWLINYINNTTTVSKAKNGWIQNNEIDESFHYFITLGLIDITADNGEFSNLTISELGKKVLRRVRLDL
ncbi:hypothetical protein B0A56_01445 [Flavobacterium columnare NBRC 100251 = ATCC 23463]|nr:hypothetical protein B0A56_01445 [Flavobacterium columnare NBRC 100251 = ATCC 23463]